MTPSGTYTSANMNTFLENGKVRTYTGVRPFSFTIKYPTVVNDFNNTANSMFQRSPFLPTTNTGVTNQGAHVFIADVNLTGLFTQSYDVFVTAYCTFKGMK